MSMSAEIRAGSSVGEVRVGKDGSGFGDAASDS